MENPLTKSSTPSWFAAALAEAQPSLYSFVSVLLGGTGDAWDVLQNANQVMLEKATQVESPDEVLRWGYTVVRFQVMAHLKRVSRQRHICNLGILDQIAEQATSQSIDFQERMTALEGCLQKLPERQRQYIALRYDEDMSLGEMATQLGRSENALAAMLYRRSQNSNAIGAQKMSLEKLV